MATKVVTGKLTTPDGVAIAGGIVSAVLSVPAVIAGTLEVVPAAVQTKSALDGTYSLTLQANADLNPVGYYTIIQTIPNVWVSSTFTIVVPQTAGPFPISTIMTSPVVGPVWDATLLHLAGTEHVTGQKIFDTNPVLNAAAFPESAVANLTADLAAKAADASVVHLAGAETLTGAKVGTADWALKSVTIGSSPAFPAGSTNPLIAGTAGAIFDTGGFAVNLAGPKYRAIGTWDPVAGTGDMKAAWDQAITDANGGTVFAPNGIYNTTSGTLASAAGTDTAAATSVEGAGWGTIFQSTTVSPIIQRPPQFESHGGHFSNFRVDGVAIGNGLRGMDIGSLAAVSTVRAAYISGIRFTRLAIGLQFINTQGFAVEGCKFGASGGGASNALACAIGCRISDNSEVGSFHNCDFRGNTGTSLLLDNSGPVSSGTLVQGIYNWTFSQCHFESNAGKAVVLDGGTYNWFIGCKYEANDGTYVTLQSTASGTRCDGNVFIGGYYNGNGSVPTVLFFDLQAAAGTTFIGGFFSPTSNGGINIAAAVLQTTFENATINCTVTDASTGTSYSNPINGRFARLRKTVSVTYSATLTIDVTQGEFFYCALTGNTVVQIPTNFARPGQRITFQFGQGGAGGFTVGWIGAGNGSWRQAWSDVGNVAGKHSLISYVYNEVLARWWQKGAQGPYC